MRAVDMDATPRLEALLQAPTGRRARPTASKAKVGPMHPPSTVVSVDGEPRPLVQAVLDHILRRALAAPHFVCGLWGELGRVWVAVDDTLYIWEWQQG